MEKQPCAYLLASDRNGTVNIGVTAIWSAVSGSIASMWSTASAVGRYELHGTMDAAIQREKRIKKWNRQWKLRLIDAMNPPWRDLWPDIVGLTPKAVSMDPRLRGDDDQKR